MLVPKVIPNLHEFNIIIVMFIFNKLYIFTQKLLVNVTNKYKEMVNIIEISSLFFLFLVKCTPVFFLFTALKNILYSVYYIILYYMLNISNIKIY